MARKPDIYHPGALDHAILRSNGRAEFFVDEQNRQFIEPLVEDGVARLGHRIHAYCWINDHHHLAVQVANIQLSKIIQNLAFRYTRWFKK